MNKFDILDFSYGEQTYASAENSKRLSAEDLCEAIEKIKAIPEPKAYLIIPSIGTFNMYEMDKKLAEKLLSIAPAVDRFMEEDI